MAGIPAESIPYFFLQKALLIKSSLVNSLANQLEEANREVTRLTDLHQKEREIFQNKLYELG
ncbi:unnamed protein product [Wuchereria bancrofti]|uniref:Uncharacterized protein n=1 Tax=Wuchereria bancrofti TaxID=6293 RepID=A0A3P7DV07_WUCBA|nr:unnamed protein product [Wuchereria bancrofti]